MLTGGETAAIAALSLLGATAQAAVTVRWYEPPARDGETPPTILEAALFFVGFGLIFALLGTALSALAGIATPYGAVATLLLTPVGLWLSYSAYVDRIATVDDEAERFLGVVVGVVAAVYPILLLIA